MAGNESDYRFMKIFFYIFCRFFLRSTANFTDENDALGLWILFGSAKMIYKGGAYNGVSSNTDARGLA